MYPFILKSLMGKFPILGYALRPPTIDELGMLSAIREHVMQAARKECIVHIEATPEPLPASGKITHAIFLSR